MENTDTYKTVKGIQFLVNGRGEKTSVIIDLKEHAKLWEDFYDKLIARLKADESRKYVDTKPVRRNPGSEIVINPVSKIPPSQLESPDTPSVYKGKPLTLEDMELAVSMEAGKQR